MENNFLDLLETTTNTRINEKWLVRDNNIKTAINKFPVDTKFKNFNDTYSTIGMDNALYQQCFLQVVTETVFHYPVAFFSEKTAKPILNKRPFVLLGPQGSLANIRSLGFKTFHAYWDEDYDNIIDPGDRINAVVDIIDWICHKSIFEIQSLCKSMEDVLNYNFNFYVNEFKKQQLEKFENACMENLKPRYD